MPGFIELVGPNRAVQIFGVKLVGFTFENLSKLLLSLAILGFLWVLSKAAKRLIRRLTRRRDDASARFWSNQAVNIVVALLFFIALLSIWFDDPGRLGLAFGLISAGLAFALQRVVTAVAAYFIILRGRLFNVGDRVSMGGVRGDVIRLGFTHTAVMEMGQPPAVQLADPAMWVEARQYTGRIVTVTNDKIFDTPVYNYTRDFSFLWEEMHVMIPYDTDREKAELALLDAARTLTVNVTALGKEALAELEQRYFVRASDMEPRVYYRLTDNWLELTVRFVASAYGIRELKDAMSRRIIAAFDAAGIRIASATVDVVGVPPLRVSLEQRPASA